MLTSLSGLLTTDVLPKVCLKKNGTIYIPEAPAALSECDVQSGDMEDSEFQAVGTTANITITFKHPLQPGRKTYQLFEVKDIKGCPRSTTNINSKSGTVFDNEIQNIKAMPQL